MFNLVDTFTENGRKYGKYKCLECSDVFKSRADRQSVMTGLCKPCANKISGFKRMTHGHNNKNSRLHVTWSNMKRRCISPKGKEVYKYKGVKLCKEWHEYKHFMDWSLKNGYDDTKTIDRIDPNKGYSPENCRYVCYSTQSANRKKQSNNKSGYIGVTKHGNKWLSKVQWKGKQIRLWYFKNKKEAAEIRDKYIKDNKLPHTLNF